MLVNKTVAAKLADVSRRTLYVHIKEKPISVEVDPSDNLEKIQISELQRVYGYEKIMSNLKKSQDAENVEEGQGGNTRNGANDVTQPHSEARIREQEKEIEMLKEMMRVKEGAHEQRIEDMETMLSEVRSKANSYERLLEDQREKASGAGEWEKQLKAVEARISNQETATKEEKERAEKILRQNRALKKALDAERNKSIWQKMFG